MADNDIIKSYRALDDNFFKNYKGQLKSNWENQLKTTINPQGYRTFEELYLKTTDGTIITLPPFLQRFLQEIV